MNTKSINHAVWSTWDGIPSTYSTYYSTLLLIWWRAFSIVTVTALNVVMISGGFYKIAFVTGGLLSYIWWSNTRTAAIHDGYGGQLAYALGASCGTVTGMALGAVWSAYAAR